MAQNGEIFAESENLLQALIDDPTVPAAVWDQAAFGLTSINAIKLKKLVTGYRPQDARPRILAIRNTMLSLARRLTRPDTTLNNNQLYFTRNNYLGAAIGTQQPIQEIRDIALSITKNPLTPNNLRQTTIKFIKNIYNAYKSHLDENRYPDEAIRAYMQEFINTFPNGEIVP